MVIFWLPTPFKEEDEKAMLNSVGVESMNELIEKAKQVVRSEDAASVGSTIRMQADELLKAVGHSNFIALAEDVKSMREEINRLNNGNSYRVEVLDGLMKYCEVTEETEIIKAVQLSMSELLKKVEEMKNELAAAHDLSDKWKRERDQYFGELERLNQEQLERERRASNARGMPYSMHMGTSLRPANGGATETMERRGIGHEELRCPTKSDTRGHFSDRQCIVCGGKGHTLKVCISDQSMKYVWRTMGGQSETLRGGVIQPPSRYPASGANASPLGSGGHNGIRGGGHGGSVNLPKPAVRMLALKCEEMKDEAENNVPFQQETSVKVCDVVETPKVSYSTHPKSDAVEEPKRVHENTHLAEEVVWEEDKKESEADDPFFVKRSQLVSGLIGGLQVEACLDTGADVNLIDKRTVDKMNGVSIVPGIKWNIQDAQRNSVKTLGTVLLDVKMEIGKECKVGFVVSEADVANIPLGNGALDAMGLALRMKEEDKPEEPARLSDNAIVLRTTYIGPGQFGVVLVGGGRGGEGPKMLLTDREDVIEGINDGSPLVRVPVWNHTDEDMLFEQQDTIGVWCRVNQLDEGVDSNTKLLVNHVKGVERKIDWREIKENLETCRGGKLSRRMEEILRARADVFAVEESDLGRLKGMKLTRSKTEAVRLEEEKRRKNQEESDDLENRNQWISDQKKDDWVASIMEKLKEVEQGKRDIAEEIVIPGSTKRTSLADWLPQSNPAYTVDIDVDDYKRRMCWMMEKARAVVVTKLDNERKNMKRIYDEKHKNNMSIVPKKWDRVYVRVEPKSGDIKKMMSHFEGPYRVISTSNTTVTVERADNGLENGRDNDRRVVQWDRVRLVPREKGAPEKVVQVNVVICEKGMKDSDCRTPIDLMSKIHPDFHCEQCGKKKLGEFVKEAKEFKVAEIKFSTLRELAVLLDCKEKWKDLTLWEAHREMTMRADSKEESSNGLKNAYRLAMCCHQVEEAAAVAPNGVVVRGEEDRVSDAISEVLARSGGRASRKNCVLLVPDDSCVQKASGALREMEMMNYGDETEFTTRVEGMKTAGSLPKSLVVLLKSSLHAASLEKIRAICEEVARSNNIAVYVMSDMLPSKMNELSSASVGSLQERLTQWRLERDQVPNFIIISSISGLLWKTHTMCSLFPLLRKESKDAFEKAIKFMVDGSPMPFPLDAEVEKDRVVLQGKRQLEGGSRGGRGGRGGKHITSRDCFYCKEPGHLAWNCQKRMEDETRE
ncbi:hypothetical protein PRIPAC_86360 [Pristionchus pacificus]|uniref:CCHC-type domain-containing protein n=1 Tax=Pristionchus pacificus TaxID=54126 RepID=A0A2A6BML6_PRIPA|nr:hypothetical protein PRIPAC_86360 [Pristionchus pacificus]|eukprot:PDM67147.1 hypothetical protein PRIPAC_48564 [Pristionchus pacificus]